jgi:hypothetical protein
MWSLKQQPTNYSSISDYDHTTTPPDTDGNDSAQGPDDNIPVHMVPAELDADNDFVDGRPGSICGNVSDETVTANLQCPDPVVPGCQQQ